MAQRYDTLVVAGGMAGLPLALRAARHGSVAFVERELLGGTCLNRGCIPTKTMIASAKLAAQSRRARDFGVEVSAPTVHLGEVVDRKDALVDDIRSGSYKAVGKAGELDFFEGEGHFTGGRRFTVDEQTLEADRVFLNTGTRDARPPIDGLDAVPHLTSRSILALREPPEHLIVVGGGFIGCEFAQMFARFGAQVTVVQRAERLLPAEESDISAAVQDGFEADGIDVLTGTRCTAVDGQPGNLRVGCDGAETAELVGTHLLVAAGRTPNTDRLGLDHLDLEPDARGYLPVDAQLHTSADTCGRWGICAARRCSPTPPATTPTSPTASSFAARTAPSPGASRRTRCSATPRLARWGSPKPPAREAAYDAAVGTQPFAGVAKARAIGETTGAIKFVADAATDAVLGCHIAGPDAGDLVHEAVIAMTTGATYTDIGRAIHIRPTLAEGVNAAGGGVYRPTSD